MRGHHKIDYIILSGPFPQAQIRLRQEVGILDERLGDFSSISRQSTAEPTAGDIVL
jgi:hypothetical protein